MPDLVPNSAFRTVVIVQTSSVQCKTVWNEVQSNHATRHERMQALVPQAAPSVSISAAIGVNVSELLVASIRYCGWSVGVGSGCNGHLPRAGGSLPDVKRAHLHGRKVAHTPIGRPEIGIGHSGSCFRVLGP